MNVSFIQRFNFIKPVKDLSANQGINQQGNGPHHSTNTERIGEQKINVSKIYSDGNDIDSPGQIEKKPEVDSPASDPPFIPPPAPPPKPEVLPTKNPGTFFIAEKNSLGYHNAYSDYSINKTLRVGLKINIKI